MIPKCNDCPYARPEKEAPYAIVCVAHADRPGVTGWASSASKKCSPRYCPRRMTNLMKFHHGEVTQHV